MQWAEGVRAFKRLNAPLLTLSRAFNFLNAPAHAGDLLA